MMCIRAGIDLTKFAVFVDRGCQQGAQQLLFNLGYKISLKFCSWHISLNVCSKVKKMKPDPNQINAFIMKLQGSRCFNDYKKTLQMIDKADPVETMEVITDESMVKYIAKIHPVSWCIFDKLPMGEEVSVIVNEIWQNDPTFGKPKPVFSVGTTSAAEGENNVNLWNKLRDQQIFNCLLTYCGQAQSICNRNVSIASKWITRNHNVTTAFNNIFKKKLINP
jgi:hypothetical protein